MDDSFIMLIFTIMVLIFLIWRVVVDVNPEASADDMLLTKLHSLESGLDAYFSSPTATSVPSTDFIGSGLQNLWNSATSSWVTVSAGTSPDAAPATSGNKTSSALPTSDVTSYKLLTLNTIPKGALKTAQVGAQIVTTGIKCPANYTFDTKSNTCIGSSGDKVQGTCPLGTTIIKDASATTRCVFGCSADTDAVAVEGTGVSCYQIPQNILSEVGSDTCPTCQAPPPPPPVLHRSYDNGWIAPEQDESGNTFCPPAYPDMSSNHTGQICVAKGAKPSTMVNPVCAKPSVLEMAKGVLNGTVFYCAVQDMFKNVIPSPDNQTCPANSSLSFGGEFLYDTVPTKDNPKLVGVPINQCKTCDLNVFEKISADGSLCLMTPPDQIAAGKRYAMKATPGSFFADPKTFVPRVNGNSYNCPSQTQCAQDCVGDPNCVAYSYAGQWSACFNWASVGIQGGAGTDCCSNSGKISTG